MLAICEPGGGQAWGFIVPILATALWGAAVFAIFRRSASADWPWLVGLLVGCMVVGVLLLIGPEGIDGRSGHLSRFLLSVVVAAAIGLGAGLLRKRPPLRFVVAAVAGDVFLPGLMVLYLILVFVGTGACVD
jgi:hypothetical protein